MIPFPDIRLDWQEGPVVKAERLGGLLNFYHRRSRLTKLKSGVVLRPFISVTTARVSSHQL